MRYKSDRVAGGDDSAVGSDGGKGGLDGRELSPREGENSDADFGGQDRNLVGKDFGGQSKNTPVAHQKTDPLPTKKTTGQNRPMPTKIEEKRGWIEFPLKGTKNPKRYAQRRRWIKQDGKWIKSKPKRIKSIKPMSEDDYVKYKQRQERIKKAERRERRRSDKGGR